MRIEECISALFDRYSQITHFVVGYSGGKDSTVLLHALWSALKTHQKEISLTAVHVNHGLSEHAGEWVEHCKDFCEQYAIPFEAHSVELDTSSESTEQAARSARYKIFERFLNNHTVVLTAHHLQDQAETVLMRLFEGAGLKGLSGIPQVRRQPEGEIFRPLLACELKEIEAYCEENGLHYIEDDSNQDTTFLRNHVRLNILPAVLEKWPQALKSIETSRNFISASQELETEQTKAQLAAVIETKQACNHKNYRVISLQKLQGIDKKYWHNILRLFIDQHEQVMPRQTKMAEYLRQLTFAQAEHDIAGEFKYYQIRYFNGYIYLLTGNDLADTLSSYTEELTFARSNPLQLLPDGSMLRAVFDDAIDEHAVYRFVVKRRVGGERYQSDKGHSRTVKKLLNELKIEPWLRERIPFIYYNDELISIPGVWIMPDFITNDAQKVNFVWSDAVQKV